MAKKKKKSKSLKKSDNKDIKKKAEDAAKKDDAKKADKEKQMMQQMMTQQRKANEKNNAVAAATAKPGIFGTFGSDIVFQVKDPYNSKGKRMIAVPSTVEREVHSRWTTYNLLGKKPKKSFEGPDPAQITLSITLDSNQGVNPRTMLDKIRKAIEKGTVEYLVIGGKIVGGSKYYIESMSEKWERFFKGGRVTKATGDIIFSEYN